MCLLNVFILRKCVYSTGNVYILRKCVCSNSAFILTMSPPAYPIRIRADDAYFVGEIYTLCCKIFVSDSELGKDFFQ